MDPMTGVISDGTEIIHPCFRMAISLNLCPQEVLPYGFLPMSMLDRIMTVPWVC